MTFCTFQGYLTYFEKMNINGAFILQVSGTLWYSEHLWCIILVVSGTFCHSGASGALFYRFQGHFVTEWTLLGIILVVSGTFCNSGHFVFCTWGPNRFRVKSIRNHFHSGPIGHIGTTENKEQLVTTGMNSNRGQF